MKLDLKLTTLLGFLFLLLFSACRKDPIPIIDQPTTTTWEGRVENVTASLQGLVVDQNNIAITDATVRLNGMTTSTNRYGLFYFRNVEMNSKGAYVTIEKDGFFNGSRRFFPQADSKNNVKIEMLTQVFSTEFNASTGGSHEFENTDVQVTFPPNAIKNEATGEVYAGTVLVAAQYLDPNELRTLDQMPGNLQGINTANVEGALKTLGMLAVELQGTNGEKLNIAEGRTATIAMPAPANINNLPAEVPLWSFDEVLGIWIEESVATLENGIYTGEVSHFSFWNLDVYFPPVDFIGIFTDTEGNPIQDMPIGIISNSINAGHGRTDDIGMISGIIPANEVLVVEMYNQCDTVIYTTEIGPYAEGLQISESIVVDNPSINSTSISGAITDCSGNEIANSILIISYDSGEEQYFMTSQDGTFDLYFSPCVSTNTATIRAINLSNFSQTTLYTININSENDLGNIATCDDLLGGGFLNLIIDDETLTYGVYTEVSEDQVRIFREDSITDNIIISFGFYGTDVGDYDNELNYIWSFWQPSKDISYGWNNDYIFFENFNVFSFTDEDISGTFSGSILSNTTDEYKFVEGSFSVSPEE